MLIRICVICLCLVAMGVPAWAINGLWVHPERVINKETADKTLDQAQRCGIDNIYVLVFHREQAWFKTPHCEMSKSVTGDFDPMAYCIEGGHKRGMKVHAWFVNGEAAGGPIMSKHPDWQTEDAHGGKAMWFEFCEPEVREFQRDLMVSAVTGYPGLDGVHFDYIRYPSQNVGYGESVVEAFKKATGYTLTRSDKWPLKLSISANPIHAATTAKVLAKFDTGMPAIMENRLGTGRVLLFNWHAEVCDSPALDKLLAAKLKEYGSDSRPVKLLFSEGTNKRYGSGMRGAVGNWLNNIGVKWTDAELGKSDPSPNDILAIANNYVWTEQEAATLRRLVEKGLNVVWVDGPASSLPDLMAVLGADSMDSFFVGLHAITPVVDDPAMPIADKSEDTEAVEKQAKAWVQWRMDCVSDVVRDVYREAKKARPGIEVTAAVFYSKGASVGVLQDWERWVGDGYIDYVVPMAYVGDQELDRVFGEWSQIPGWQKKVIPGLSIYTHDAEGKAIPKQADDVARQIKLCADHKSNGQVYFCCHYISPEMEPVLKGK